MDWHRRSMVIGKWLPLNQQTKPLVPCGLSFSSVGSRRFIHCDKLIISNRLGSASREEKWIKQKSCHACNDTWLLKCSRNFKCRWLSMIQPSIFSDGSSASTLVLFLHWWWYSGAYDQYILCNETEISRDNTRCMVKEIRREGPGFTPADSHICWCWRSLESCV